MMSDAFEVQPCAIIVPYYNNPEMLKHQVSVWERYSGALTENMQFVLVDDCSKYPAEPIFKQLKHNKMLFRVRERLPWNQHQCRNIGGFNAQPRKNVANPWLLLTDIDIVFTAEAMLTLLTKKLDRTITTPWSALLRRSSQNARCIRTPSFARRMRSRRSTVTTSISLEATAAGTAATASLPDNLRAFVRRSI
jgi:hypothetical protein